MDGASRSTRDERSRQESYLRPVCGAACRLRAMMRFAHGEPIAWHGFFEPSGLSAFLRDGRTVLIVSLVSKRSPVGCLSRSHILRGSLRELREKSNCQRNCGVPSSNPSPIQPTSRRSPSTLGSAPSPGPTAQTSLRSSSTRRSTLPSGRPGSDPQLRIGRSALSSRRHQPQIRTHGPAHGEPDRVLQGRHVAQRHLRSDSGNLPRPSCLGLLLPPQLLDPPLQPPDLFADGVDPRHHKRQRLAADARL